MLKVLINGTLEDYMNAMKIYRKKVDPYGNKIKSHQTKNNRTTFYVPKIQK